MSFTLDLLIQLAHGISTQFGTCCEIVIHDLRKKDIDSSIVYIEHGEVTNRVLGDGPSGVVLKTLHEDPEQLEDHLAYLTKTADGRILKSSTMYVREKETSKIEYIFSLNYDITGLITMDNALKSLIETEPAADNSPVEITHNVNDLLDTLIEQSVALVGKPVALMTKDDKVKAIQYLNDCGAFLITKSGDKVSEHFGISKFTLYSYMDTNKQ